MPAQKSFGPDKRLEKMKRSKKSHEFLSGWRSEKAFVAVFSIKPGFVLALSSDSVEAFIVEWAPPVKERTLKNAPR